MDNEIVERIELKIAFLERANHELSDVVYRQQRELDALRLQLTNALGRINGANSAGSGSRGRNGDILN